MDKTIYLKIIAVPIAFVLITAFSIELYNIYELQNHKKNAIKKATEDFIETNTKEIYKNVHQVIAELDFAKKQNLYELKKDIKFKVDNILHILNNDYQFNKNIKSKDALKEELLNIVKSQNIKNSNNYFFVLDIKTGKALAHNIKSLEGKILKDKKDLKGTYTFQSKVELLKNKHSSFQELYFEKPSDPNKQYKKIVYFKKFKEFDWIIGTGRYLMDQEIKMQKRLIKKYNSIQNDLSKYIFISDLHNINGGKEFATMLVMPNNKKLINQKISDDKKDTKGKYHRKQYLKELKLYGETFIEYYYKKPNSSEEGKKLTYFYLYKPWGWIIGSGFYFEDLERIISHKEETIAKEIEERHKNTIIFTLAYIIIAFSISYLFANNIVSQIKLFLDRIEKQRSTFKALFENSSDGIILIKHGEFSDCNQAILNIFKASSKNDIINSTPWELSPHLQSDQKESKTKAIQYINKTLIEGSVHYEWIHKRLNGELFEADITLTKINIDNTDYVHVLLKDISEKKTLEKESKQKDSILIQQSKMAAMGEMIGNIAHQWRQPLNALSLTVQKIKMYHDNGKLDDEMMEKSITKSKTLIKKMSSTIDDFRDFFRVDKQKAPFNIKQAIEETIELLDASLKNNNIKVDISTLKDTSEYIGFKNEFEQVILNIINNAKDSLTQNNISDPVIEVTCYEKDQHIFVEIADNAGGVPSDIINKIFEPYFTTKDQGSGTGIGLYMSKMIIENNMGGTIEVQNKKDGACFTITLLKEKQDA
ncbi:MAG: cache domain-containing protein [Campylobacterota bacterium]|nr:cache domain-containing protein [Campylobacterota bacterium]